MNLDDFERQDKGFMDLWQFLPARHFKSELHQNC